MTQHLFNKTYLADIINQSLHDIQPNRNKTLEDTIKNHITIPRQNTKVFFVPQPKWIPPHHQYKPFENLNFPWYKRITTPKEENNMPIKMIKKTRVVELEDQFPKNTKRLKAIFEHHKIIYKVTYHHAPRGWCLQRINVLENPLDKKPLQEDWIIENMGCRAKTAQDLIPEDVTPILITITYEKQVLKDKYYSLVRHYVYKPTNVKEIISEIYHMYDRDFNESDFINLIAKLDSILVTGEVFDILNDRYTYTLETGLNDPSIEKIIQGEEEVGK